MQTLPNDFVAKELHNKEYNVSTLGSGKCIELDETALLAFNNNL